MKKFVIFLAVLVATTALAVNNSGRDNVAVTFTPTRAALGSPVEFCYFNNTGTNTIYFTFGENTTPTTNSFPVAAGATQDFTDPSFVFVSYNCATGLTSTLRWGAYGAE